jgi:hypothetical protein
MKGRIEEKELTRKDNKVEERKNWEESIEK